MAEEEKSVTRKNNYITAEDMGLTVNVKKYKNTGNNNSGTVKDGENGKDMGGLFGALMDMLPPKELMGPISMFIPQMIKKVKQGGGPVVALDLIPESSILRQTYANEFEDAAKVEKEKILRGEINININFGK
jgi:hypothetical protein